MAQAAPFASVMFHNLADEVGVMGGGNVESGPLGNLLAEYLSTHEGYQPEDARYLENHKGHLMYVRPDETHVSADLARAVTLSGTPEELAERIREIRDAGYTQLTVQLVHGHEAALEEWAQVFESV